MKILNVVLLFFLTIFTATPVNANEKKVAISKITPLCFLSDKGIYDGFSIDLLDEVSKITGDKYNLVMKKNVTQKLQAIKEGTVDMSICGITNTSTRLESFDSVHIMETGLRGLSLVKNSFFPWDKDIQKRLIIAFFIIFIVGGFILPFVENLSEKHNVFTYSVLGFLFNPVLRGEGIKTFGDGVNCILEGQTTIGFGRASPKTRAGNFLIFWPASIWGIINLIGLLSALLLFNVSNISKYHIENITDLQNYSIGAVSETSSIDYLKSNRITPIEFENSDDLYQALLDKKVDIVIYDEVSVLLYAKQNKNVVPVGPRLNPQDYVWFFPLNSPYRKIIESSVLEIRENGTFENLYTKWFGI